jgi:hypothetical protein
MIGTCSFSFNGLFVRIFADHCSSAPALTGGLIVALEHRFYGDSLPNGPNSDTPVELLKYLSSQQAYAHPVFSFHCSELDYAAGCTVPPSDSHTVASHMLIFFSLSAFQSRFIHLLFHVCSSGVCCLIFDILLS